MTRMRPLARRMGRLGTETAFEVLARARALEAQGRSIVHLEIGEPDFDTPKSITAAGVAAIERGDEAEEHEGLVEQGSRIVRSLPIGARRGVGAEHVVVRHQVHVAELLDGLQVFPDRTDIGAALELREDRADAHASQYRAVAGIP